eukprot:CAMPEP_0168316890 /NCGR_PEP_ID=MMETSP0210-20121227/20503_1 /TAXON_ID=40633 /ORGANISM="Condylostoma magnum, Strain COL2" /LENGTH=30 /DNA_ID= /DNA_START= /DNA_END= /DNA_ORIENTATION=
MKEYKEFDIGEICANHFSQRTEDEKTALLG